MIKVCHTVTSFGSVITILESKLRQLDAFSDLDITVVSSPPDRSDSRQPAARHVPIRMARSIKPWADIDSIWRLYRLLKCENVDVVHSHTAKAGFITAVAAKMAGVPVICHTYHGLPFFDGQNRSRYTIYRLLEKSACMFRDYVFTQNKRDLQQCVRLIGDESRAIHEGNGVDIEFVTKSACDQLNRGEKDYHGEGLRLVLLSRLEAVKRISDFFRVVEHLRRDQIDACGVVAGAGVLERQLKNELAEMGLTDCVNMVGFNDHPHGLIAASDIVVLCSEKEGIPRSVMEAMALKKPVVATDVLGTQELVVDGETGFLVGVGDIETMVARVKLLASDADLRSTMGDAGYERVGKYFDERKIAGFLHDFYSKVIHERLKSCDPVARHD